MSGTGDGTRTRMSLTSLDFESSAYANFATPASKGVGFIARGWRAFNDEIRRCHYAPLRCRLVAARLATLGCVAG